MKASISVLVLPCVLALAPALTAGALEPTKASDLVEAYGDYSTPCIPNSNFAQVNVLQHGDNTTTAFAIPSGMVLVITEARIYGIGNPNDPASVGLYRFTAPSTVTSMGFAIGVFDLVGNFSADISFGKGAVVKSGTTICALANNRNDGTQPAHPSVLLHGYFAKDK